MLKEERMRRDRRRITGKIDSDKLQEIYASDFPQEFAGMCYKISYHQYFYHPPPPFPFYFLGTFLKK